MVGLELHQGQKQDGNFMRWPLGKGAAWPPWHGLREVYAGQSLSLLWCEHRRGRMLCGGITVAGHPAGTPLWQEWDDALSPLPVPRSCSSPHPAHPQTKGLLRPPAAV